MKRFARVATNYKSDYLMQNLAQTYTSYGQRLRYIVWSLSLFLLLFSNIAQAQEPCPAAYVIGDPDNPNSQTWLSQTELYAAYPNGFYGNGDSLGCIHVYGKLKINRHYMFDNCTFVMGEKAEIEVRSNKMLRVKNNTFFHGREKMWRGINLSGYRSALDMENSTVKDAQYAVKAQGDVTRLRLVNNTFDANYIGLYASPFGGVIGGKTIQKMGGNNYFKDNRFVFDSPYLPPYTGQWPSSGQAPYAAIEINDVVYFNIGIPGSDAVANTIENIQHGVINRGGAAGITISINQYSGFLISHPDSLYNNSIGFLIDNTPITVNVMDNHMEQVMVGIRSNGSQKKNIRDNTINAVKQCIYISNEKKGDLLVKNNRLESQFSEGILLVGCKIKSGDSYNIESNDLTLLGNAIGISVYDSEGSLNIMNDNQIHCQYLSTSGGVQNRGIQLVRTQGPTTIKGNVITSFLPYTTGLGIGIFHSENTHITENRIIGNFRSGIHLAFSPKSLLCCNQVPATSLGGIYIRNHCQDSKVANTIFKDGDGTGLLVVNGYIGEQINTGNDWTGAPNTAFDAMYLGDSITASAFFTNPDLIPNGHDKISVPLGINAQEWFTFEGTDPTCEQQINCGVTPYIVDDPTILPYLTDDDLRAIEPAFVSDSPATKILKWEAQKYLYNKLVENPTLIEMDDAVYEFYQSASKGLIGQMHQVKKGMTNLKSATSKEEAKTLLAANASLSAIADFQQLEKDIQAIYLSTVAKGINTFTPEQKVFINELADQCPYTKGTSVFLARTLKQYYEPGWHWPIDECLPALQTTEEQSITSHIGETDQWIVFPNPAHSYVTIKFHEPIIAGTPLSLLDATGQTVAQQQVETGSQATTINVQGLATGIYFVKMKMSNGVVLHSRVAVVE